MADLHYTCVDIRPDELITWAHRTRLPLPSDEQLDAAYTRAHDFIGSNKDNMVQKHGWKELRPEENELFFIFTREPASPSEFALPTTFTSLRSNPPTYLRDFTVQRQHPSQALNNTNTDYTLAAPTPLCNIFYMLQCIAPGMFQLVSTDTLANGTSMLERVRTLPTASWVSHHRESLTAVRGSAKAYEDLLDAAQDDTRSFYTSVYCETEEGGPSAVFEDVHDLEGTDAHHDAVGRSKYGGDDDAGVSSYAWTRSEGYDEDWDNMLQGDDNDEDPFRDYTACGQECGYCGHCDYDDDED